MDQNEQDRKALQDFIVGNAELEKLEALLDRFNIFEAVGMERQEIRHSKFLAFLLDPNESHGMGDAFAKRLLQRAAMDAGSAAPVTPIELSLWDLGEMSVWRERQHIDIFLLDERQKLAVIIENKIGTGEHGDQLDRYHKAVREEYPDHRLLALYLTPDGDEPSHPDYLPVSYRTLCEILDDIAESRASVIEPDARVLITHYTEMLRRHIVGDSEIARLSRQIYQKHQRAIDLIYEHRFAQQEAIREIALRVIRENPRLVQNKVVTRHPRECKEWITFWLQEWDAHPLMVADGKKWTGTDRILLLMFCNYEDSMSLIMQIGPGDEETRSRLLTMAHNNPTVFEDAPEQLAPFVNTIFVRPILAPELYEHATDAEREAEIRKNWADFLENDLPRIDAALKREAWIWEPGEAENHSDASERFVWGDGDISFLRKPDEEHE